MNNPFKALIAPRLPSAAVGLEADMAAVVALDRRGANLTVRAAAHTALPAGLLTPRFDEPNVAHADALAEVLAALATEAGLARRHRWSAALPQLATRTATMILESEPASRAESAEMLNWKIERSFGAPPDELRVATHKLTPDERGRSRYLATAAHLSVLAEYEAVFDALGWHVGLMLPSYFGEAHWLATGKAAAEGGDALMVNSHAEGLTVTIVRGRELLLIRSAACEPATRADELYRLLLFYRDRVAASPRAPAGSKVIERLLVLGSGNGLTEDEVRRSVVEALEAEPRTIDANSVGLVLPTPELSFAALAAPAGVAAMKWD